MKKLIRIRCTLVVLQLVSITVASVILIAFYNPWLEQIIDEAERSGNAGQSFANQINRTENEEIVIIFMCAATIVVSLLGIVGTIRSVHHGGGHSHCLLNFYLSTLIIFLFVIFVAFCGVFWEIYIKLQQAFQHHSSHQSSNKLASSVNTSGIATTTATVYRLDGFNLAPLVTTTMSTIANGTRAGQPVLANATTPTSIAGDATSATWWYIIKSFIYILLSTMLFTTALRLTRRILESFEDRYLSANDDNDDLNSEASSSAYMNNNPRLFGWGLSGVIASGQAAPVVGTGGLYNSAVFAKSLDGGASGCESVRNPFKHI